MTRDWFKCVSCGIECDNSVRYVSETGQQYDACQVCMDSYCPCCDSLYPEPEPVRTGEYFATCEECGTPGYFDTQTAQNIKNLQRHTRKEAHP